MERIQDLGLNRKSGILLPVSSLPSPYGIGSFGKEAYQFIDFLSECRQSVWQVLPLNPTSYGDSPYQSPASMAGNPYFIDPETLLSEGLLTKEELKRAKVPGKTVNYGYLFEHRYNLLRLAYSRFKRTNAYERFLLAERGWLDDYALFMALKVKNSFAPWTSWSAEEKTYAKARSEAGLHAEEMDFWRFLQYEFFTQWARLRAYANKKGIKIIGDMPIYVAHDSMEVWRSPESFLLDEEGFPTVVAGCPPDAYSEDGQLWGNPLYDWDEMEKDGYKWWSDRIKHMAELFDAVRIDHFRGIESYWSIPAESKTAKEGKWIKGPGMNLVKAIKKAAGKKTQIIAEDLGDITPEVFELVKKSGFPGMRVFQFGFISNDNSTHLPHNYCENCVAYTGTHDNNTLLGYLWELDDATRMRMLEYCGHTGDWKDGLKSIIRCMFASNASLVIMPIQDLLGYGSDTRVNTPGRAEGNWAYRITKDQLDSIDKGFFRKLNEIYWRV